MKFRSVLYFISLILLFLVMFKVDDFIYAYIKNGIIGSIIYMFLLTGGFYFLDRIFKRGKYSNDEKEK
ncbi:hypothetical protein [Miniphocaeibacter massiliensis]|uniref:hypothetical protein n=1 Tax=Miniphocaeibacter massiliensis TaxID=2041841 RepID=UPI000C1B989C|nr:hypothetical protein [Miniphocaeibacter massiliensis]